MTFPLRDRAAALGVGDVVQSLLGCTWGRTIFPPEPTEACPERAAQIVVLHAPDGEQKSFKLCEAHSARVLAETEPHKET
jgi:hypothetical protein